MNTRILPVWPGIKRNKCWEFKILRILKGSSLSCQQKGVVQGARCICDSQNSAFYGKRTAKYRAKSHEDVQVTPRIQPEGKNMGPWPSSWRPQSHVETWWMLAQSWTYVIYMCIYIIIYIHDTSWYDSSLDSFFRCVQTTTAEFCRYMSITNGWPIKNSLEILQVISFNSVLSALGHSWPQSLALLLQMRVLWAANHGPHIGPIWPSLDPCFIRLEWRFPKIGVPPKSSIYKWDFPWNKPSSYWGIPIYGTPLSSIQIYPV